MAHKSRLMTFAMVIFFAYSIINPASAYTNADGVQTGDTVDIEYVGTFQDGEEFDAGRIQDALMRPGQFIDGFYRGILGMKVNEQKIITVPPSQGYTDEGHPLYGRTLIFDVFLWRIVDDVNGDDDGNSSSGAFNSIMRVAGYTLAIGGIGVLLFLANNFRNMQTTGSCVHCRSIGRSTISAGTCGKCGNAYCRRSFAKGCPNCKANSFIPHS